MKTTMKMRRGIWVSLALVLIASVVFMGIPDWAKAEAQKPAKVYKWTMQALLGPGDHVYDVVNPAFINNVRVMSGGRIDITLVPPGSVVGPFDAFHAVGKGSLQLAGCCPPYKVGYIPLARLLLFPFIWEDPSSLNCFQWEKGGIDIIRKAYAPHNVFALGLRPIGNYGLTVTTRPVRTIADFKGLKLRALSPFGDILKELGGSVVTVPMEEMYTGIATGVIDGVSYGSETTIHTYKLHEVAKYILRPPWAVTSVIEVVMNLDLWNSLPDDLKRIVQVAYQESNYQAFRLGRYRDTVFTKEFQEKWGVKISYLSNEDLDIVKGIAFKLYEKWGKADPLAKKWYTAQKAAAKELGIMK